MLKFSTKIASLILSLGCLFIPPAQADEERLCPHVTLRGEDIPGFTDNEIRLVCGDSEVGDAVGNSWRYVPRSQAKYHLNVFLQTKGYFSAKYTNVGDNQLVVDIGVTTKVTSLEGEGVPPGLNLKKRRRIIGQVLTPDLLNEIEKWAFQRLQALGYGCPEVTTEASPSTGEVVVRMETNGPPQKVYRIIDETVGGIRENVLNRYNAFRIGDTFNGDWVTVTERRVLREGILQGINFTNTCDEEGVVLKRTGNAGLPRVVTVGVGTNTEGILLLRASWKNTRIGDRANIFSVSGLASNLQQQFNANLKWFVFHNSLRSYLQPAFTFRRRTEENYATNTTTAEFHYAVTYDNDYLNLDFNVGPTIDYISLIRGVGADRTYFSSMEATVKLQTHAHEFYMKSPRTGYQVSVNALTAVDSVYSTASVTRLNILGDALYNFRDFDPPSLVFGIRGGFSTVMSDERPGPDSRLPPTYYRFLGGSQNVRGFGRETISNGGAGYMTTGFLGGEVRFAESFLPFSIEPFLFYDLGLVGTEPWKFNGNTYHSPGLGLRWESPVGTIRVTGARGIVSDNAEPDNTQFYFSFGEEF